jgi:quercetin dioxygenase-like cupin family protein
VPTATHETVEFLGNQVRVLHSGDGFGLVDMVRMHPGDMPPLHLHRNEDEGFHVLEGELTLFLPGREIHLTAGEFALAPRGIPHCYRVGEDGARVVVSSVGGGFERFVTAVVALDEVTPETLSATAAAHDIEILGPPGLLP